MHLFANDKDAINKWLGEHPAILGAAALVFALVFIALGVSALLTGKAATKRGPDLEGGEAKAMAIVWLVFGGLCLLFGIYKLVSALF